MKKNKKVYMILTNGFDPDVRVYKEAKYLVEKKFDVTILCWDRKCEYKNNHDQVLDGIKIKRFLIPSKPGSGLKQLFPYFKFIFQVRKYLKNKDYSYLHCHDFDGMIVGLFTRKRKNKKTIFDMHEIYNNYSYAKNKFFKFVFNSVLKKSNYIIYVNDEQIKNIKNKKNLIYLPNYPEEKYYVPLSKIKNDSLRINYVGSLRDYESLNTLANLAKENKKMLIGFYGTGICYDKLANEYMDKFENIKIYGKYNGIKECGSIYRNTDILYCIYNPKVENWKNAYPVKLYEAIVTLTPIVVVKNTKMGDFVEKYKIGETVEYKNLQMLKKSISKINKNYQKYIDNIKKIKEEYKWEYIIKNLDAIYN